MSNFYKIGPRNSEKKIELNSRKLLKIWAKREIQNQNKTKKYRKRVQNSGRYDERNSKVGGAYGSMQDPKQNLYFSYGKLDFEKISTKFFRKNEWIFLSLL